MSRRHRHTSVLVFLVLGFLAGAVFLVSAASAQSYKNRLLPHITIQGRSVENMNKTEVFLLFDDVQKKVQGSSLEIEYSNGPFATFSASVLNARADISQAFEKAYIVGRSPHIPSRIFQSFLALTGLKTYNFPLSVSYTREPLMDTIAHIEDVYGKQPVNATFAFENRKVSAFQKEENGLRIEQQRALLMADTAIQQWIHKQVRAKISVEATVLKPHITLAQTNTFGIEELIGEGTSNYTHSIPEREHNVLLGTSKLNGILIPKDAVFSFNETIGDISALTGYKPAYIIKEGKTVLGDGGGICQVSTTLFRAALHTGLPIVEHHSHAYRVGYYENDAKPGLDATVFAPTVDLKFLNDTGASILIQTVADKETKALSYRLYGKKDNRNIELSEPIITNVSRPEDAVYQDDPTLKRGITKQVEYAALGARSQYRYKVTKNNTVVTQKDFNVWYKPWRAVFLVGTAD